ncbi:MlaD family protein [Vibrio porteresiae]|uniref:MlaD family protein n=1 Tax=Vibrio porteresiae DSM 19223 TaxID=1123496 RepID=A0ABZ0Q832_9VIBR|nr:MlaD family protein [Vibrio porteresiae]WPC72581.1 MlaD family protein [Vibrio porteresiae DSM 19223]
MNDNPSYSPDIKRSRGISPLWILPIITMLLAGWLVFKAVNDAGERIQIHFSNGQGLVAGRTTIRYQGLEVGMIRDIKLSSDLESIYVDAEIYPEATKLLSPETQFWLVKPQASLSGISGLDALVSGNYIAVQPGNLDSNDHPKEYHALDNAPTNQVSHNGLLLSLKAKDLGGLSVGSQIIYRKIPIGEVLSYQLNKDNQSVLIQVSIKDEYQQIITKQSRFWNVSGVSADVGFDGMDVRLENMSALIGGAIAVDSPDGGEPVEQNAQFILYKDVKTAGRGIPITIQLPDNSQINPKGSPIVYRGIEIGQVTDISFSKDRKQLIAAASIEPAFSDMLNSGTHFVVEEPELSLNGMRNVSNLVKGNFLSIKPGTGERSRQFTAQRAQLTPDAKSISLTLEASDSYGLEAGSKVLYRGIPVGMVSAVSLQDDHVLFNVNIEEQYRALIRHHNRFYITGTAKAALDENGVNLTVPPMKWLLAGSISFISEGKEGNEAHYPLYPNQSLAELAQFHEQGSQTITLTSPALPSVQMGSPLLYRNLKVGSITKYALSTDGVTIEAKIDNQYQYLITPDTVFWNHSGVKIDASLAGVSVQAAPLQSLIKGGIAFDSIKGVENKVGEKWKLYDSYEQASQHGSAITLTSSSNPGVKVGTPLEYQGVKVGEIKRITPNFKQNSVAFIAELNPQYSSHIAKQGSVFWLQKAQVNLNGIDNIDKLLQASIAVKPGKGEALTQFTLQDKAMQPNGVQFVLQSRSRGSVTLGTPVLYRDIEVGHVTDVRLGDLSDRVISTIEVKPEYAYLIRSNTVFWNASGVDVSIGLSGANIKSGTMDSLLRGGISFATPPDLPLKPIATAESSFLLHRSVESDWLTWQTPIPKP